VGGPVDTTARAASKMIFSTRIFVRVFPCRSADSNPRPQAHGVETKLVLPGLEQQKYSSRCDPVLIKAIARGRAWFGELASGRARSLQELAGRDGISRRYIRRLVCLAFLSPELVEASLQGRHPVTLTATGLMELDLPLDWTEQHRLLAT
jgi:site-specific DNA recombinase